MPRAKSKKVAQATPQNGNQNALKKENTKLRAENRNLLDLTEWRSASMAHLAHELRTPLTSILGFSEIMLSQEELTESQRNFCQRIQNSAHQLQRTLDELAELSRTERPPKKT